MDPRLTTKAANGQDIINYANGINGQYGFLLGQVEGNTAVTTPVTVRLAELEKVWTANKAEVQQIETGDVTAFHDLLKENNVPGLIGVARKERLPQRCTTFYSSEAAEVDKRKSCLHGGAAVRNTLFQWKTAVRNTCNAIKLCSAVGDALHADDAKLVENACYVGRGPR